MVYLRGNEQVRWKAGRRVGSRNAKL